MSTEDHWQDLREQLKSIVDTENVDESNKNKDGFFLFEGDAFSFTKGTPSLPVSTNEKHIEKDLTEKENEEEKRRITTEEEIKKEIEERIKNLPAFSKSPVPKPMMEQMINLVMQMGSSQIFLSQGRIDDRKLAVLSESDQVSLGHFDYRARVDGQRYFGHMVDWLLTSSASLGGLRARQLIQLVAASGGGGNTEFAKRPSWFARQTYKRGWQQDSEEKGQVIVQ